MLWCISKPNIYLNHALKGQSFAVGGFCEGRVVVTISGQGWYVSAGAPIIQRLTNETFARWNLCARVGWATQFQHYHVEWDNNRRRGARLMH